MDASADPPVARLVDAEALKQEERQKEKEQRKKQARWRLLPPPPSRGPARLKNG